MSTTTVNKRRFTAATEAWENAKKKRSAVLVAFISCTTDASSPVNLLKGSADVLKTIGAFCGLKNARKPREEQFNVKVRASLCRGTEHVWVELLMRPLSGSLSNQFLCGALMTDEHVDWMRSTRVYSFTNPTDGSFWNETQLRDHFAAYLKTTKFCLAPHHCRGLCCALPGDTLIMNRNGIVHDWIDTSQQELADRGWLHGGGLLFSYCEMVRNDPSQLEEGHEHGDEE